LFFIKSGFSRSSGVQSDGATIQLARIFTGSAPYTVPAASKTVQVTTQRKARMSPPIGCRCCGDDIIVSQAGPSQRSCTPSSAARVRTRLQISAIAYL
jgi:hypothetical protein